MDIHSQLDALIDQESDKRIGILLDKIALYVVKLRSHYPQASDVPGGSVSSDPDVSLTQPSLAQSVPPIPLQVTVPSRVVVPYKRSHRKQVTAVKQSKEAVIARTTAQQVRRELEKRPCKWCGRLTTRNTFCCDEHRKLSEGIVSVIIPREVIKRSNKLRDRDFIEHQDLTKLYKETSQRLAERTQPRIELRTSDQIKEDSEIIERVRLEKHSADQ